MVAVVIVTVTGLKLEQVLAEAGEELEGIRKGKAFRMGLVIASVSGILSAMLAVGFDRYRKSASSPKKPGLLARNAALARRVVVLHWCLRDERRLRTDSADQEQVIRLLQDTRHVRRTEMVR